MAGFERKGRVKHPDFGDCIKVGCILDRKQQEFLFPVNQAGVSMHPKHPSGYYPNGQFAGSFSPSLGFYSELCRYAQFKRKDQTNAGS